MGGSFLNALLGISRPAAKLAKRSLKKKERLEKRWRKEEARIEKEAKKIRMLESNQNTIQEFENKLASLQNLHKQTNISINWQKIFDQAIPPKPINQNIFEKSAISKLNSYRPTLFDRIFFKIERKKTFLKNNISTAIAKDKNLFIETLENYKILNIEKNLAKRILQNDITIYKSVFLKFLPETGINNFVTKLKFYVTGEESILLSSYLKKEIVPIEKPTLLKSGKLRIKNIPKTYYNEIYKNFVFSITLRMACETFAILPVNNVTIRLYKNDAKAKSINDNSNPILIAKVTRNKKHLIKDNSKMLSDIISSFNFNYNYTKTNGFKKIESKFL